MGKPKLHMYIPGLPQRSYEYRRGDSILVYDDNKHCILIDGGERELFDKMVSFLRANGFVGKDGYAHVTQVITHWHGDHDCALKYALESPHVYVDKVIAPDPAELKLVPRDDGYSEYSRAISRINQAKSMGKPIEYPASNRRVGHWVGKIRMWMWRQKANPADYVDYQVNDTSIQTYFPDLEFLTGGDIIDGAFQKYLKKFPNYKITGFKINHHGNACQYASCDLLTEHGAKICYYTDWEPSGVSIGGTTFSKYGARRCKQYFTTLRPFSDITIDADGMGHVTWSQSGKSWVFDVEYGKGEPLPPPDTGAETVPIIHANAGFKGYNVSKRTGNIEYIVVHYVGAESGARDNVSYFNSANRGASADYFIGHDGEICEYNPNPKAQYTWHCGGSLESTHHPLFQICMNKNSIGVELCTKKQGDTWTFSDKTVNAAVQLVRYLMRLYGVSADHVCRHYDVTGKACPRPWVDDNKWNSEFKSRLSRDPAPAPVNQIYRVRKSWSDAKSQLGAFSSLDNARAMRDKHEGYHIYDANGVEVS